MTKTVLQLAMVTVLAAVLCSCGKSESKQLGDEASKNADLANSTSQELGEKYQIDVSPSSSDVLAASEPAILGAGFWYAYKPSTRKVIRKDLTQFITESGRLLEIIKTQKVKSDPEVTQGWANAHDSAQAYLTSLEAFEQK